MWHLSPYSTIMVEANRKYAKVYLLYSMSTRFFFKAYNSKNEKKICNLRFKTVPTVFICVNKSSVNSNQNVKIRSHILLSMHWFNDYLSNITGICIYTVMFLSEL